MVVKGLRTGAEVVVASRVLEEIVVAAARVIARLGAALVSSSSSSRAVVVAAVGRRAVVRAVVVSATVSSSSFSVVVDGSGRRPVSRLEISPLSSQPEPIWSHPRQSLSLAEPASLRPHHRRHPLRSSWLLATLSSLSLRIPAAIALVAQTFALPLLEHHSGVAASLVVLIDHLLLLQLLASCNKVFLRLCCFCEWIPARGMPVAWSRNLKERKVLRVRSSS